MAALLTSASQALLTPIITLFAVSIEVPPNLVGLVIASPFVAPLFLSVRIGSLVDAHGPRRTLAAGALGLALSCIPVLASNSLTAILTTQVMLGVFHLAVVISAQALVAQSSTGRSRDSYFGWYTTFLSAGQLLGPIIGGVIADIVGFSWAFGFASVLPVASLVCVWSMGVESRGPGEVGAKSRPVNLVETGGLQLLLKPGMVLAVVSSGGIFVALTLHQTFLPIHLDGLGLSTSLIGLLVGLRAFAAMAVRPFTARIVRLFKLRTDAFLLMQLLTIVSLVMFGILKSVVMLAVASCLVGIGSGFIQPMSIVTLSDHIHPSRWGYAMGLRLMINRFLQIVAPLLLGVVAHAHGLSMVFILGSGLLIACGFAMLYIRRPFELVEATRIRST